MADTLRVLYVDDEPTLLEMAKLFLEMRGVFAVDTLTSAGMALDRLNKEQYDAIISDYQMPDIDGIEFLKRVRASGNTIPFILFTGRGREEVVIQALNEGADFYLQKGGEPVSQFTELSHQIQQVVHHRRVDDSLRESEGRFEAFMDRLPVTAFIKDEKFTNLFVNRRMEEMFGAKEWIGKSVYDLFPGDAAEKMIEDDRQTLRDGYRTSVENLVGINGDKKIFETYKFRIDRENKPPLIGGFAIDITEQQLEKQALYENEQRLTSIFNTVGDVIFQLSVGPDEQYHFTSVNSAFSRTTGLPPGQVIGRTVKEIIPEPSLTIVLEKYRQAIEKKTIIHWEEISSYPTGQLIGEVSVAPIFDEAGKCTHLIGSVHDITERKRSEDALRESEGKFRSLAESSPDYIMRYDRQGRHTYINPAALRASGLTEEQIIGKTHHESGFDETQNQFPEEKIIQVFLTGKPYQGQFTRESVKGRIILDLMLTPEFADDGTVRSVFGVSRDITQLKLAEEELLKKNEELNASYEEIASSEEELRANLNILTEQEVALKESEAKFQSLYMHMIEGAALHELTYNDQGVPDDYIIIETNPAFEIHLGISRDNVIGKTSRVAYGVNEPPYLDIYAGVALTGEPQVFETYFPPLNKHFSISAYCPRKGRFATIFEDITERKRVDEALEKSQIQLTEAMDLAHLVNWEYDVATGIFTSDDRFYALYGTTAEREGGTRMPADIYAREFVHPDDQHMVADEVKKAIQAVDPEYVSEVEHRIIRRDGAIRNIVVRFGITKDENGRTVKTHGANQDITERKRAEAQVRESENKFTSVFNGSPVPLTLVSATDGKFVNVNDAFVRATGYTRDEVIGVTSEALGIFADNNGREQLALSLRDHHVVEDMEISCRAKTGEIRPCLFSSGIILIGGKPHILSTVRDNLARKRAEDALRDSEMLFREIFDKANDAVFLVEQSPAGPGRYVLVNEGATRILGYTNEELLAMSPRDIVPVDIQKKIMPDIAKKLIKDGVAVFESANRKKDGTILPIEVSIHRFHYKGRDVDLSIVRDITERKIAEEALVQANQKLNLLSGTTRHDINNQLAVLKGYLALLEKKQPVPALGEYFHKVKTAADRISTLIQFTKEYEEIGHKAPVWQNIRTLVETAAKDVVLGDIRLENDIPDDFTILSDPLMVKVFFNLMDNAVRYGGKITIIRFLIKEHGGDHVIVCEDDGDGIPADEKEKIFEKGFGKNTGLGLFLSREILAITGITIRETGEPGKGARFEMDVPKGMFRYS